LHRYIEADGAYNLMGFIPQNLKASIRDGSTVTSVVSALQDAADLGVPIFVPRGVFIIDGNVTRSGRIVLKGTGQNSIVRSNGEWLTVTSGSNSQIDGLWLENITAPWIITRNPANWATNIAGTLRQSNAPGYQPTVSDLDIWGSLSGAQQNQQIGPRIQFKGNAEGIEISRIFGRFVVLDILDARYSTVRNCSFRGGKGGWGAVNFDNATTPGGQSGIGNSASNVTVLYSSNNGIIFQRNDRPIITGNTCDLGGESGVKAAGGGNRFCTRAIVAVNQCNENYYDGIDLVTSFPTNMTTEALHEALGNHCARNGGDGINVDGRYSTICTNTIEGNGRFGIWCTGRDTTIHDNVLIDNNQERNAFFAEILGGGGDGCTITENRIQMGAGANSAAIFYDKKGKVSGNHAIGGKFFFGAKPSSFLSGNVDDASRYQYEQSFVLSLGNVGGTLQHAIFNRSGGNTVSSEMVNRVIGVSVALTNTPTGADVSTAFAAGGKIGSASTNKFWFDTADQIPARADVKASLIYNDTGTEISVRPQLVRININGVTRVRLVFDFVNTSTGAAFALTTANIGLNTSIQVQFTGRLA
jgi:hypothetical protein